MQSLILNYAWSALKLEDFAGKPQYGMLMQLLVMLNDLDSIAYLNDLLSEKDKQDAENNINHSVPVRWIDGVRLYLLRQNILGIFEGLSTLDDITDKVEKIRNQGKPKEPRENEPLLSEIISEDEVLSNLLAELNCCLRIEKDKSTKTEIAHSTLADTNVGEQKIERTPLFKTMDFVRDKLSGHVDEAGLKCGMQLLLARGIDEGVYSWRIKETTQSFRAFFMDDIITDAWRNNIARNLCSDSSDKEKNRDFMRKDYSTLITKVKKLASEFTSRLLEKYIEIYKLEVSQERKDVLEEQMVNVRKT